MHHFQKTKTMSTVLVKDAWLPTPQNAKYKIHEDATAGFGFLGHYRGLTWRKHE